MKSKYLKILISLILVVSLCLAITVAQSSAVSLPIVVGGTSLAVGGIAWIIANAMGVEFDFTNFSGQTIGTLLDPFYTVSTTLQTSDFALIKGFRSGYDALRLSLAAYDAIKAGSQNIITDEGITDNTTGSVSYGTVFNVPLDTPFATINWTDSAITTPDGGTLFIVDPAATYPNCKFQSTYFNNITTGSRYKTDYPIQWRYHQVANNGIVVQYKFNGGNWFQPSQTPAYNIPQTAVTFDYASGTINLNYGSDAVDNVTIVFPQSTVLSPTSDLESIMTYINNQAETGDLDIEVDAVPPPPIPTDALGDIPFDQFIDIYGGSVFEEIDNQTQVIDTLGQSIGQLIDDQTDVIDTYGQSVVEGIENQTDVIDTAGQSVVEAVENQTDVIDTVGQDVVEAVEAVDTNIQAGNGILSGIRSLIGTAADTLEDIGEMVGELVEDIVLGTETLISGILNQIPSLFNVILSPIKTAASIWHYVVEWIQSITGPFQFIWSMANGTSYYIVLPVYASLAAAVVLAFYKRFGK